MGELEAVHLQHVEEGVAHHVGDAVLGLHQTAVEPEDTAGVLQQVRAQQLAVKTLRRDDGPHLLSQSQCDMVKMLLLKTPYLMWKDVMVCLHWSCSRQHLSVSEKTPARVRPNTVREEWSEYSSLIQVLVPV